MNRNVVFLLSAMAVAAVAMLLPAQNPDRNAPYMNRRNSVNERVEDLLRRMTPREKAEMLSGSGWMESQPNQRLGIPAIKMADGPMGVRNWIGSSAITSAASTKPVTATAFPAGIAMAATWDPDLVQREAEAIAQQAKALGRNMILAPTVNIARVPVWGRNFEGYGEDPFLASRMAVAFVKGVQSEKVIPSVKHFAANNQEFERHRIDEAIDKRTLNEIYLPAFRAAVQEARAWAVMAAYNKVNGSYCAENTYLLTDTLQKRWGFAGFVISDWGGTYSTAASVMAGMNLEMPGGEAMRTWFAKPETQSAGNGAGWLTADKVLAAVESGQLPQARVDEGARRILRVMFTAGLFDNNEPADGQVDTGKQRDIARTAATESIVLLKNEGEVLPFDTSKIRTLAVIGPSAAVARTGGGGSSLVRPRYAVSPLDGFRRVLGSKVKVNYALGAVMEGEEAKQAPDALRSEAVALAGNADAAVVVVGYSSKLESEGFDRPSMDLPAGQNDLIEAVAAANKNTVVVIQAGSPVTMPWIDHVPAVLHAWYGGQEGGYAIADIVFGNESPSGRLPVTFPKQLSDSPAYANYPGQNLHVNYGEGIFVGYRGFDSRDILPLFPFGHGLTYTKFAYSEMEISPATAGMGKQVTVRLKVHNTGSRPGVEVVQLYLHDVQASVERPVKELKGFQRVALKPGQEQTVTFTLDRADMSFYDGAKDQWVAEPGEFEVYVGSSSRDLRLKGTFELTQ